MIAAVAVEIFTKRNLLRKIPGIGMGRAPAARYRPEQLLKRERITLGVRYRRHMKTPNAPVLGVRRLESEAKVFAVNQAGTHTAPYPNAVESAPYACALCAI
jgi:hypothetical protein